MNKKTKKHKLNQILLPYVDNIVSTILHLNVKPKYIVCTVRKFMSFSKYNIISDNTLLKLSQLLCVMICSVGGNMINCGFKKSVIFYNVWFDILLRNLNEKVISFSRVCVFSSDLQKFQIRIY